ncbi:DAK2 domain-containing protein [Schaalia sp. ZJ1691]|uniref:DAK2 domain-containing protein n=1 Tax=Schaalia sp. ZJ1691 TaxID=2709404 RepID=UPI0013EC6710|nr:DAK2 domain-containing protein [Schaalia sp. ZJ1691]
MPLTAATLQDALGAAADEASRLAPFLNDLDGWDGCDCDTGSNAAHTLAALAQAARSLDSAASFAGALEVIAETGVTKSVGHIGVILTGIFAGWAHSVAHVNGPMTPVALRRMFRESIPADTASASYSSAIDDMLAGARRELDELGETLPDDLDVISRFSMQAQIGLVEATDDATGRIDAGGAVLALVLTCLDSAARKDPTMLESFAQMLADLASRSGAAPSPQAPPPGRDFTVDIVWQGSVEEFHQLTQRLQALGARMSIVGGVDLFGLGTWRIHGDTSAPIAAVPRCGRTIRFQVSDARPDADIGVDDLQDEGLSHRGVRLLERRPVRRVERASVIACTRAPGLVEDLARAGAVVFLNSHPEDAVGLWQAAVQSSTGVALILPCDDASRRLAVSVASLIPPVEDGVPGLVVAESHDDLAVLAISEKCAPLFVPQPGGREVARQMLAMLHERAGQATAHSLTVAVPPEVDLHEAMAQAIDQVRAFSPNRWRLLLNHDDNGPMVAATIRQMLAFDVTTDVEIHDGGQPGPTLIQGLRQ